MTITPHATPPPVAGTAWVPVGTGYAVAKMTYRGAYSASTTYMNGDVVADANNVAYVCVIDNTLNIAPVAWSSGLGIPSPVVNGQWIKGVGGVPVWAAITPADVANIPYGTSLPASPYDGQEAVLVDSTSAPNYQWRFRYNAGSSNAQKWEFVGGAPWLGLTTTAVGLPGSWANVGPAFTPPRTGLYWFMAGITFGTTSGALVGVDTMGVAGNQSHTYAAGTSCYVSNEGQYNCTGGSPYNMWVYNSAGGQAGQRWLRALPIRLQ